MPDTAMPQAHAVFITRLPQTLLDELDRVAYANGQSRAEAVRRAIAQYIVAPYTPARQRTAPLKYDTAAQRAVAVKQQSKARVQAFRERKAKAPELENTLANWTNLIMGKRDTNANA